ncbi:MAG: metal ABC transporter permease [Aquificae bacterium]|nr:metal ABC transporter permease [Aquificota bacterium]
MLDILQIPFIQNAIVGGLLIAVLLSVLSLFINIKNWSFINVGISHATFGGLALGVYLGISPIYLGILFAVSTGLLIGYISKKGDIHEDISIGILFSISMALGVIFLTLTPNYTSDLFSFLFGNILTITREDIYLLAGFSLFTYSFLAIFFRKILFCCYNEEVAYTAGINTDFYYYSLITIIAIATVLAVKLVGVILASAMIILPAATASQIFWHYKKIIISSIILSILVVLVGIFVSYQYDLPSGATTVFIYGILFFFALFVKKLKKGR